jgi:septum formation protein
LAAAGLAFDAIPVDVDESRRNGEPPETYVVRVARAKADVAAARTEARPILAADTIVVVDGRVLGKPRDDAEAADMLASLSGRSHDVMTGVVLLSAHGAVSHVETTRVHFLELSHAEIAWYVATGEPRDKAGAYAVQGLAARFVSRVEGSHSNVVGLPVAAVYGLLRALGSG